MAGGESAGAYAVFPLGLGQALWESLRAVLLAIKTGKEGAGGSGVSSILLLWTVVKGLVDVAFSMHCTAQVRSLEDQLHGSAQYEIEVKTGRMKVGPGRCPATPCTGKARRRSLAAEHTAALLHCWMPGSPVMMSKGQKLEPGSSASPGICTTGRIHRRACVRGAVWPL